MVPSTDLRLQVALRERIHEQLARAIAQAEMDVAAKGD
jgi:hypothetical protein